MIDTHLHLDLLSEEPAKAVEMARAKGVEGFITVGTDLGSSRRAIEFAASIDGVYASVGVHPHSAKSFKEADLGVLRDLSGRPEVVGVGETGLDFYRNISSRESQIKAFEKHVELANEVGLPLIVHQREAEAEVQAVLESMKPRVKVLMHCFSGSRDFAGYCNSRGFYISFSGNVTFKNASSLQEIAKIYPLEMTVIETDSPYLSPEPVRGRENGPHNLPIIARKVADLRGIPVEELIRIVTGNSKELFSISD